MTRPLQRLRSWWWARLPAQNDCLLTHRNVYILPTTAGWMLGLTLVVLLLTSINYQLNLGYALTFLLAGSAVAAMHVTHANLRGLRLQLLAMGPATRGQAAAVPVRITPPAGRGGLRAGLCLMFQGNKQTAVWFECASAEAPALLSVPWLPQRRGVHHLPRVLLESRYPLGLFRAWTWWQPQSPQWVYPAAERNAPPPPAASAAPDGAATAPHQPATDPLADRLRPYRSGDPWNRIVWKKSAGSPHLVVRDHPPVPNPGGPLWLDWRSTGLPGTQQPTEAQLERLCAWLYLAEAAGRPYGLRLPQQDLPPNQGPEHRRAALEALALSP